MSRPEQDKQDPASLAFVNEDASEVALVDAPLEALPPTVTEAADAGLDAPPPPAAPPGSTVDLAGTAGMTPYGVVPVPVAAPDGATPPGAAPAPLEHSLGSVVAGPYRIADPRISPEGSHLPRRRPVIGPALSVFGVLLWAFVVAGQFTTSLSLGRPLDQKVAIGFVAVATLAAWIVHVRWSAVAMPARSAGAMVPRAFGIGALAVAFFLVALVGSTVVNSALRSDLLIAVGLVALSTVAAAAGPRLTLRVRPERTHRERVTLAVFWIAGAVVTLVAGIDLAANG